MKVNDISLGIIKKAKKIARKNERVEFLLRKLKSYIDTRTHFEVQSLEANHSLSLDSLIKTMHGKYNETKKD
jgi:hypothetical protein